jgi:hypothetical protein
MFQNDLFDQLEVLFLNDVAGVFLWSVVPRIEADWKTGFFEHANVASRITYRGGVFFAHAEPTLKHFDNGAFSIHLNLVTPEVVQCMLSITGRCPEEPPICEDMEARVIAATKALSCVAINATPASLPGTIGWELCSDVTGRVL